MRTALIVAVAVAVWLGTSTKPTFVSTAQAEGMAVEGKDAAKGASKSVTEAAGKLKTDAGKTKEDVKAMDVQKAKEGVGQVKGDVKDVKESAKETMKNPMGTGK